MSRSVSYTHLDVYKRQSVHRTSISEKTCSTQKPSSATQRWYYSCNIVIALFLVGYFRGFRKKASFTLHTLVSMCNFSVHINLTTLPFGVTGTRRWYITATNIFHWKNDKQNQLQLHVNYFATYGIKIFNFYNSFNYIKLCAIFTTPVSYTHLDVYKRQLLHITKINLNIYFI